MSRYHSENGLFFERLTTGQVKVVKTDGAPPEQGGKVLFEQIIAPNIWASAVLSMTKFGERPGDFQAFNQHHMGEKDMLVGQRGGY